MLPTLLLQNAIHVSSVAHPIVSGNRALATIPGTTIRNNGNSFKYPERFLNCLYGHKSVF